MTMTMTMTKYTALLVLMVSVCALASNSDEGNRIVGGYPASAGQFPYQVSLQINGQHICGGSIISQTKILTAAHCIYGNNYPMDVVAGITTLGSPGQRVKVARRYHHESYSPSTTINDVAVLILQYPLSYNQYVRPVNMATVAPTEAEVLTLSGWGVTSFQGSVPQNLQYIHLRNMRLENCAYYLQIVSNPVTIGHVCTSSPVNQGACNGDSGGPLVNNAGQQVGIVSWGIPCARGRPDVFTNVAFYYNWILAKK